MVMSLQHLLRNNSPSNKPELWDSFARSLFRQGAYRFKRIMTCGSLKQPVQVLYDEDIRIEVNLQDAIGRSIYLYGVYEYATTKLLDRYLELGLTFCDVGANLGYYSLYAAKRIGADGAVYAFEAAKHIYEKLRFNISLNTFRRINVYQLAICNQIGNVEFYINTSEGNSGLSSLEDRNYSVDEICRILVPCTTFDQFVVDHNVGKIDLIKIDVEGSELLVLHGAKSLLTAEAAPDIIFECFENSGEIEFLERLGYEIYDIGLQINKTPALYRRGKHPLNNPHRAYEPLNLFATKKVKSRLRRLITE